MTESPNIAIVGATGLVGEALLETLNVRKFPCGEIKLLASAQSAGKSLSFADKQLRVSDLAEFDFNGTDLVFFAAGGEVAEQYVPDAIAAGCKVVDCSSAFRLDPDVPLVAAEANPEVLQGYGGQLVASPDSLVVQLAQIAMPLHRYSALQHINLVALCAVSSQGRRGVNELASQTARLLNAQAPEVRVFSQQVAFNLVPQLAEDGDLADDYNQRLGQEVQRILGESVRLSVSSAAAPVFFGHTLQLQLASWDYLGAESAREILVQQPGIELVETESDESPATAVTHAAQQEQVFISGLRDDESSENALSLWSVADNVRRGAALNCVQIAEIWLHQSY